ncbi:MAG TPA: ATP-binding protein [Acidimicrobiia bacterium]|jgi:anti-sigma regulatory factor (Ser/Thr protein kinase)
MVVSDATIVTLELENDVSAARHAREFLRDVLRIWCLQGVSDVAELLTGELVANVVRHVGAPMALRAVRRPSSIRVEVDDPSTALPVRQDPQPSDDHGRGIVLVESLASAWGVAVRNGGKTVWFELDLEAEGARSGEG